jgi:ATP-dependent RNA helicase RhlE
LKDYALTQFADLGLAETILRALSDEGYTTPTPIQAKAIPDLLKGRDLLGIAQTGTGKTAAFALPIIQRLIDEPRPHVSATARVLVMAPTRELVAQIADSFRTYGRHARVRVAVIVGGVGHGPQVQAMARGVDVLVATPGRLLDHMAGGTVKLSGTQIVVLDEADHMLDLGFIVPIRKIVSRLPKQRQSLFFSATMPREIATLAGEMLTDPVEVTVTPPSASCNQPIWSTRKPNAIFWSNCCARKISRAPLSSPAPSAALIKWRNIWAKTALRQQPFMAIKAKAHAKRRWPNSKSVAPACWSPLTLPHVALTSTKSRMS